MKRKSFLIVEKKAELPASNFALQSDLAIIGTGGTVLPLRLKKEVR
jgi:hypothetical protein